MISRKSLNPVRMLVCFSVHQAMWPGKDILDRITGLQDIF
jgi:hypothetical protein